MLFILADKLSYKPFIRLLKKHSEFLSPQDTIWHVYSPVRVFYFIFLIWLCEANHGLTLYVEIHPFMSDSANYHFLRR